MEPHNHHVNATEWAIQTFKDAFIAALATTNQDFPLQLRDRLAPQVQDTLNLIRASRINPNILAYEALNGPYNWDRYPLAPPGCKAIIYKAPAVRGSWALRGTDAWYLGPSADHYRCNNKIWGSAELFPQHCQVPKLSNNAHLKALTEELEMTTCIAAKTHKGRTLIKALGKAIKAILNPPNASEQRGNNSICEVETQRENEDIAPIPRISNTPAIMKANDLTAKRNLIKDARTHWRITQNNTPGAVPAIQRVAPVLILPDTRQAPVTRRSNRVSTTKSPVIIIPPYRMMGGGKQASARLISQQALNAMTMQEALTPPMTFTPQKNVSIAYEDNVPNFAHFASLMVHTTMGENISSFKWLMNDPETAKVWQTALAEWHRGTIKQAKKGMNSVFVMTHKEIDITWTYARMVVDYQPQKRITIGSGL